jgi:hypothetical protein
MEATRVVAKEDLDDQLHQIEEEVRSLWRALEGSVRTGQPGIVERLQEVEERLTAIEDSQITKRASDQGRDELLGQIKTFLLWLTSGGAVGLVALVAYLYNWIGS